MLMFLSSLDVFATASAKLVSNTSKNGLDPTCYYSVRLESNERT